MTRRQINLHLAALALLGLLVVGAFVVLHSRHALPWLIDGLASDDARVRRQSAASLARLGAEALPAVDALLRLAQPERKIADRTTAAGALAEISPAASASLVPGLVTALGEADRRVQYEAAMTLADLGPLGRPALPALVDAASDADDLVRRWSVHAIGRIGAASPAAVQALIAALGDASEGVRHDALLAFSYGFLPRTAYAPAQAELQRLRDQPRHAANAAMALRQIEAPRPIDLEVQLQVQSLQLGGVGARIALQKLALFGADAAPALPALVGALDDRRPLHRYLAVEAIAAIGPTAASALPALRARLSDEDALVRAAAAAAVAALTALEPAAGRKP